MNRRSLESADSNRKIKAEVAAWADKPGEGSSSGTKDKPIVLDVDETEVAQWCAVQEQVSTNQEKQASGVEINSVSEIRVSKWKASVFDSKQADILPDQGTTEATATAADTVGL